MYQNNVVLNITPNLTHSLDPNGTTPPVRVESKDNEEVTPHTPDVQDRCLNPSCIDEKLHP